MPRKKLIRTNLYPYHVTIRCNNKEWFDVPLHIVWNICKRALCRANSKHPVKVQAFVLMSNHYHLMIWTPLANIDKFMFELNRSISFEIRSKTGRINRIFGDRYKWTLIDNSDYYSVVLRYIYQNPIKKGIVEICEDYPFSTLNYLVKNKSFPLELHTRDTLELYQKNYFNCSRSLSNREEFSKSFTRSTFKPPKCHVP
ncbi:transposase IS200-like protein [Bacteriovorax sp. BSW11_IV]|uniref:transposase n=1 Tax=Bacteriovorax sp. BSW11_IV TaxID=1353529 RepID=UPI000389E800|nr:transposase [Bacteriovorax sp. BSW11_IV]EQC48754.1 transposase IS200-like protein [Bacteriovorax sp. BSW11_IV]